MSLSEKLMVRTWVGLIMAAPVVAEAGNVLSDLESDTPVLSQNEHELVEAPDTATRERNNVAGPAAELVADSRRADALSDESSTARIDSGDQVNNKADARGRQARSIEEIVVTATRRAEAILDVPISITAITADDIDRRGLADAGDYLRGIPGVNQTDSANGQTILIRGIASSAHAPSTAATYFGETPTTFTAGPAGGEAIDIKLIDIDRVEVLRGPQGTAFGSSSFAGAVRTIPVAPEVAQTQIKVGAGYSATSGTGGGNYDFHAIGNLPLIRDKLAVRAVAYKYEDTGFYRNRAPSVVPPGAVPLPDNEHVGDSSVVGGRIAALYRPTDNLRFTVSYLTQEAETDGFPLATSGTYEQSILQSAPEHAARGQLGGVYDTDIDITNAMMEFDLKWASLLATYSHTESGSLRTGPLTAIGFTTTSALSQYIPSDIEEDSAEVRLATSFEGAWNFLAGLYFEDRKEDAVFSYLWTGTPATNPYVPGSRNVSFAQGSEGTIKQKAAYTEVSWNFLPSLTLTGGVRVFNYERDSVGKPTSDVLGAVPTAIPALALSTDDTDESFRGNLSYTPNDHTHVYAGWGQGFRLGAPGTGLSFPATCDQNGDGLVDGTSIPMTALGADRKSDWLDNYEIGGKFALLDRRLNVSAAVFRMNWTDIPVALRAGEVGGSCGLTYTANAGEARSEGVEFQATYRITQPLRVDFGTSYTDARITKDAPLSGFFKDDRLPGSPKLNANLGLQYEFGLAGHDAFVRVDSIYVGDIYGNVQQSLDTKYGEYIKVDILSRISIQKFDIGLFVENLTNEDAYTFRGVAGGVGPFYGYRLRPRTVGVRLGYDF